MAKLLNISQCSAKQKVSTQRVPIYEKFAFNPMDWTDWPLEKPEGSMTILGMFNKAIGCTSLHLSNGSQENTLKTIHNTHLNKELPVTVVVPEMDLILCSVTSPEYADLYFGHSFLLPIFDINNKKCFTEAFGETRPLEQLRSELKTLKATVCNENPLTKSTILEQCEVGNSFGSSGGIAYLAYDPKLLVGMIQGDANALDHTGPINYLRLLSITYVIENICCSFNYTWPQMEEDNKYLISDSSHKTLSIKLYHDCGTLIWNAKSSALDQILINKGFLLNFEYIPKQLLNHKDDVHNLNEIDSYSLFPWNTYMCWRKNDLLMDDISALTTDGRKALTTDGKEVYPICVIDPNKEARNEKFLFETTDCPDGQHPEPFTLLYKWDEGKKFLDGLYLGKLKNGNALVMSALLFMKFSKEAMEQAKS